MHFRTKAAENPAVTLGIALNKKIGSVSESRPIFSDGKVLTR